jgi:hypothetical protein
VAKDEGHRALADQRIADGRWQSIGAARELFRHGRYLCRTKSRFAS